MKIQTLAEMIAEVQAEYAKLDAAKPHGMHQLLALTYAEALLAMAEEHAATGGDVGAQHLAGARSALQVLRWWKEADGVWGEGS